MFTILGFYKFKKIKSLKKNKVLLQKLFIKNNIRGSLIISKEGINGSVSGKTANISLIRRNIKNLFGISNFDSENLSKNIYQPFHKSKIASFDSSIVVNYIKCEQVFSSAVEK